MYRRKYLATIGVVLTGSVAGCSDDSAEEASPTDTPTPTSTDTLTDTLTETPTDTPTETETETPTPEPASFEVVEINAPDEVRVDEEWSFSVTIENTGEASGRFETSILAKGSETDWQEVGSISEEIEGGEQITYDSKTGSYPYIDTLIYLFDAIDIQFTIQVLSATLSFGEDYRSPDGIRMTVNEIELKNSYTYEDYQGEQAVEEASSGNQWAFVWFEAENDSGSEEFVPLDSDINLRAENTQYDSEYINKEENAYDGGEVGPSIVREGWIAYEISDDLDMEDLRVEYFDSDFRNEWGVRWQA